MNLGENIYNYRTKRNMSQGDLADAMEVSRQSVSKWENNSAVPELDKLMKLAEIFEMTLDELVSGEKAEAPAPSPVTEMPAPPLERFPAKKVVGTILLCCGLLCAIVCTILAYTVERGEEELMCFGLGLGIPLALLGLCMLLVRKHTLLACGWILFLSLWLVVVVLSFGSVPGWDSPGGLASLFTASFGASLSVGTLVQMWSGKLGLSLPWKIVLTALILFMLVSTVLGMLPPRELVGDVYFTEIRPD